MTSYMLFSLLFTELLLGSFHVVNSQSPEVASSVTSMTSTDGATTVDSISSTPGSSSSTSHSLSSSSTAIYHSVAMTSRSPTTLLNSNATSSEDGPTSLNSSSTAVTSPNTESTKQLTSSAALNGTTNFTAPAQTTLQYDISGTTTSSDGLHNATVLFSSTTIAAANTSMTASSTGSSHISTSVSNTTSPVITQTNSSTTLSTVATGNSSHTTTASLTSHQTENGTATTGGSSSTDKAISTTRSASTSAATTGSTSANITTGGQSTTTLAPASSTATSNSTWHTTESVTTVETVSSTSSTVTSYSTTDAVSVSSTANYSTVGISQTSTPGPGNNLAWVAAPVILGILLIVGATVVVLLLLRRRQRKQRSSKFLSLERRQREQPGGIMNPSFRIDSDDNERSPPAPVRVEDFVNHVAQLRRDSDYGFASEFTALNKMSPQHSKSAAELPENRTKNRFTNILPFDHSRVKLIPADDEENGGSDYINASFLPGFSSRREFIAAQGPMKSTVDDFWRMIWEYNVTTVVMVTNLFERGREKCVQYWPEQNEPIYYADIQVELKSESSLNYYIIRVLDITVEQRSRRVMHYQFLTWPDFGVPKEHSHLLSFLTQVRSSLHPTTNQPVLVHCSAGVGRTGTFILIDHVLQLIRRNSDIDLFGLVLDMRNYRSHMIQTEAQYIFAHECVKYAIELGYHQGRDIVTSSDDTSTGDTPEDSLYMNSGQRKH